MNEVIIEQKEKISGKVAIPEVINGAGIKSIEQTSTSSEDGGVNTITVTLTDGGTSTFEVRNGSKGSQGNPGEKGEKGESAAQSDWDQNDFTALDYIKNRPFYEETTEIEMLPETSFEIVAENTEAIISYSFPYTFETGKEYTATFDGEINTYTAVDLNGAICIASLSLEEVMKGNGWACAAFDGALILMTMDTSIVGTHTISISGPVTYIYKIDEKYLPEDIATKSEVEVAKTTADNAKTTADNAKTTADNAKTTADKNKETLSQMLADVLTFTFDKQTSGRDTFKFNSFNYYKISDFNPAPEDVISFKGTRENGNEFSKIKIGSNCVEYGLFIVVASAGACSIPITETVTKEFTAPSAGLYALYDEGNTFITAGKGEFTLMSIDGLTIKSSTDGSTKKFRITVDDSGAPTVTNESDSTNIWKPINLPTVTASDAGKFLRVSDTGEWVKEEVNIPSTVTDDHINSLIDSKLGVIENGTY